VQAGGPWLTLRDRMTEEMHSHLDRVPQENPQFVCWAWAWTNTLLHKRVFS